MRAQALNAAGQRVAVPSRITQPLNENNRVTLRGNTHPLALPQFDQGAVADSQPINRMLLLLQRSPDQEQALRDLLDQQQSSSSPNYHQWLTPQQFGQQFGPSDADVQTVTNWLQSHGFQVNRVSNGRTVIEFSGNAGQVRGAFNTEIHRFVVNGQAHVANASDPQIPAALEPVVAGPVSMHNFGRKPLSKVAGLSRTSPGANGQPELTGSCQAPGGPVFTCYVVAPADFATIYNTTSLLSSSPVIDGTGQTIAIVADSNINCADVKNFRSFFSLPVSTATNNNDCSQATSNVQIILDGPDPGLTPDEVEADLDSQWSGAVAPGAHIDLVVAEDTDSSAGIDLSAEYILDNNLASVLSISFGACERSLGNNGAGFYAALWEQAAAQGITVVVSSGDSGAAGCDNDNIVKVASNGLAVSGIASTPFDVAVGGTDFDDFTNQTTFWNSSNTGTKSVKGYVPEIPWDDSCATSSTSGCTGLSISNPASALNIVAGGGGQSNCLTQTGGVCTGGFAKPAWQSGSAVTGLAKTDTVRDIPDVSFFAAAGSGSNSFYPICQSDAPNGAGACPNSFIGVGGTSSSAPAFAGIMAMVNQYMGTQGKPSRQGNANYVLYSLASQQVGNSSLNCNSTSSPNTASSTGCTFYDITLGSNSVPCVSGTGCTVQNVNANTPGLLEQVTSGNPNGTLAWQAGTGYDMATGLGSVNAFNLVHGWPSAVGAFTPTSTTLSLCTGSQTVGCSSSSITITHGATVFVDATVTPNPGSGSTSNPSKAEDIALIGSPNTQSNNGGSTSSAADRLSPNGNNIDIYPLNSNGTTVGGTGESTTFLVGGSYAVTAHYTGDGTFGASDSPPVNVTVNPEGSRTTITFAGALDPITFSTLSSTAYGLPEIFRVDVLGATSLEETATGNVSVTDNSVAFGGAGCCALNSEGFLDLEPGINLVPTLAAGAHSFVASYAGDAGYLSSASAAFPFTVTAAPTTVTVSSNPTSVGSGGNVALTATVNTDSIGAAPGGTVTFFANGVAIATGTVNYTRTSGSLFGNPPSSGATVIAHVVASLNYSPSATTTVTAMYNAGSDTNYSSSSVSSGVQLTVTSSTTFSISSPNNSSATGVAIAAPGGSGSSTLTITSINSFTGTVTLSCSVAPATIDEPTCGFAGGNTVTLTANGSQTKTLTLGTTAASALPLAMPNGGPKVPQLLLPILLRSSWILALLSAMGAFSLLSYQRRYRGYLWLAGLVLIAVTQWSCANKSSVATNSNAGTATGTYTVTVSGTSGSTSGTPASVFFNLQ